MPHPRNSNGSSNRERQPQPGPPHSGDNTRRGNQGAVNNPPDGGPSRDADKFSAVPGVSGNTQAHRDNAPPVQSPSDMGRGWSKPAAGEAGDTEDKPIDEG